MLEEPRFIYFDLGNVLLYFDHHRGARQMAAVAGLSEQQVWDVVFGGKLHDTYESGGFTTVQFCEEFCRATNTRPDFDALMYAASDIFWLNPRMVPIVGCLHAARYRLGLLSNTNESHWQFVGQGRYAVLQYFFEVHALSFQLGTMKPERQIYEKAAALAQVDPETIFFTDDREENVAAACEVGFDAVVFRNAQQLASDLRARGIRWNY